MYEVKIYNISKMCDTREFTTPKEAYKLLTIEEINDPHCVYENIDKSDNYNYGHSKEDVLELRFLNLLTKDIKGEECDDDENSEIFLGIKINKKGKISDYWFE